MAGKKGGKMPMPSKGDLMKLIQAEKPKKK